MACVKVALKQLTCGLDDCNGGTEDEDVVIVVEDPKVVVDCSVEGRFLYARVNQVAQSGLSQHRAEVPAEREAWEVIAADTEDTTHGGGQA